MAVLSRDFGGLKLSGRDAEMFVRQVASGEKLQVVTTSLERGRRLHRLMVQKGRATIDAGSDQHDK